MQENGLYGKYVVQYPVKGSTELAEWMLNGISPSSSNFADLVNVTLKLENVPPKVTEIARLHLMF